MKKNLLGVFTLFILSLPSIYAQAPASWVVNPSAYNNSMTITAVLNMSSVESRDTQDVVAAFIGSEVRGVGSAITPIASSNRYIAYFVIYSNDLNELVTFKLYNKVTNKVTSSVTLPVKFIADGNIGTFVNPLVIKDNNVPTDLTMSNLTIQENKPASSLVGTLNVVDEDLSDTHVFTFLDGVGFEDNTAFEIFNGAIYAKSSLDFEAKSSYTIRIQAEDSKMGKIVKTFQITVIDDALPTVFTLSKNETIENLPVNSVIGDFNVAKENRKVFDLSLVSGIGGDDNASFEIVNNQLRNKAIFDFETKSIYKIRVQATNTQNDVLLQTFEIIVKDDNLPTVFTLSKVVIDENKPVGSVVGDFTVVKEDRSVFALSLIDGDGAEDNSSFEIIGNALKVKSIFDFEAKSTYRIRVKAVSTRGDILEQTFEIEVKDDNLPTVFALSKLVIDENKPVGSVVGDFTVVKEDRSVFALSLIDGDGAEDNSSFEIIGNALKVKSIFDFEAKSTYRIRVKAVSTRGDILEQTFEIEVKDDNLPTIFTLSKDNIDENLAVGTIIGDFVVVKENRNNFNLSLSDEVGGEDNASFELVGSALKSKLMYDFEDKKSFRLRIKAENAIGDVLYANFVIHINDVNDAPVLITSTNYSIKEDLEIGGLVGVLSTKDQDQDVAKYSFLNTGSDYKYFQILGNELLLKQRLDFETQKSFQFDLVSNDGRGGEVTQTLFFTVVDVNENPVILNANANNLIAFSVSELDPKDTVVGKIEITDQDTADSHTYKIVSGEKLPFAIDANGVITLVGAVDYEKKSNYSFQVVVTDNGTPQLNDAVNVEIEIEDEVEAKLAFNNFVSPNNDGKNDFLVIENIQLYKDYNLSIYNVRGQLVFSVVRYENNWSGEGLSQGEYYLYFIGKNSNNEEFIYKEVINLVIN